MDSLKIFLIEVIVVPLGNYGDVFLDELGFCEMFDFFDVIDILFQEVYFKQLAGFVGLVVFYVIINVATSHET